MPIDLEKVRSETPGIRNRIHLNNAGAALMPNPVLEAMVGYLNREAEVGGYEAAGEAASELDGVYDSVARLLGCGRDEIALTENATVAWQLAFYALTFRPGDRILTARAEYAANYVAFLQIAKRTGASIEVIPSDDGGVLDPACLEQMLDERVKLIAITWVPTNGGLRNPAAAVGAIARRHGITYLLDACQAVGQMPTRVEELGCDILTGTGRKFLRGPRGTGFLYIRRELLLTLEPPMIDHFAAPWVAPDRYELRRDARRFETWENNYAARLGLGRALDYALDLGLHEIENRCGNLSERLRNGLRNIEGVAVHDLGPKPASIVTFSARDYTAANFKALASRYGFNVSASAPSSTLLDAAARGLPTVVRASPHYYNTEDEIDSFTRFVRDSRRK
ncbi:aminotransferase class V-fold PLP-dependent enzyme [Sinorhizobium medicae]|uniref:Aminotransferase class V n=1 Tax=Sinorhizobium medicae (strain WSM419) TaxID=366394 RepID=A6U8T3_SINMW|nr:aminotransferase class V-fold PLP-dependent enzyme [Sinorhizobium medicae]ABR60063.1 aminotransferase class V [Sinorhizobium medicae WSM419]MDX0480545.1 aminotransferase class V-fold PLP-dependent enzyme [Sinorhizobium medicae]MDX0838018.1 aminotransferase class V-fold PLP-dependent enzyme [Sinorhizobium medicae]MDX0851360.1 aminotransferase class V-fold PLP-dependent enzyme [Sinorhizobium medicae]MDX0898639.1 aminotransferase class V-fold PLP-dependent enzyme [Sinorhizobium medicae]